MTERVPQSASQQRPRLRAKFRENHLQGADALRELIAVAINDLCKLSYESDGFFVG